MPQMLQAKRAVLGCGDSYIRNMYLVLVTASGTELLKPLEFPVVIVWACKWYVCAVVGMGWNGVYSLVGLKLSLWNLMLSPGK